jgi:hypothetical protein
MSNDDVFPPFEGITAVEVLPPVDITTPVPASDSVGINALLAQAVQNNVNVEILERLLVIRRELRAEAAKEAFDDAMRAFQGECQPIIKRTVVPTKSGATAYKYAPFEELDMHTKALRAKHGFSFSIETETLDKHVRATCIVRHIGGHEYIPKPYGVPLSIGTAVMSNTQIVAAALSFATRYAFKNAFGLTIVGEDNEVMLQRTNNPSDEELEIMLNLITQSNLKEEDVAKRFKVDNLARVSKSTCLYITTKLKELKKGPIANPSTTGKLDKLTDEDEVIPGLND